MREILIDYQRIHLTTWAYLSSLLVIGLFFKFSRFWSVRNLDLVLLILLAPGLLQVHFGYLKRLEATAAAPAKPGLLLSAAATPSELGVVGPAVHLGGNQQGPQQEGSNPATALPVDSTAGLDSKIEDRPKLASDGGGAADAPESSPAQNDPELAGRWLQQSGYLWLFAVGVLFLIRLLIDPMMVRRPLLEPNLTTGGMAFIGCSLFVFLMANVISSRDGQTDKQGPVGDERLLAKLPTTDGSDRRSLLEPGNPVVQILPSIPTTEAEEQQLASSSEQQAYRTFAKVLITVAQWAVVAGIVAIGYTHFGSTRMGIAGGTLYLMLPYTAQMTGQLTHVLPAAFLVWAVLSYRRPLWAGICIGLAISTTFYPLFLLPLWVSFYWQRGRMRFISGILVSTAVMTVAVAVLSRGLFLDALQQMYGVRWPQMEGLRGIWEEGLGWDPVWRITVLAGFVVLCGTFAIWPAQKNLGTLLSCSAAVMLATQFWHGFGGGVYMAWYLPLLLLTIFRPNLEDCVALTVLGEGWFPRRRLTLHSSDRAA